MVTRDDFTGSGTGTPAGWTKTGTTNLAGGQLSITAGTTFQMNRTTADWSTTDETYSLKVDALPTSSTAYVGPQVRVAGTNAYRARLYGTGQVNILRVLGGVSTMIAGNVASGWTAGAVVTMDVIGSTVRVLVNGAPVLSVIDTNITAQGTVGIYGAGSPAGSTFDYAEWGDAGGAAPEVRTGTASIVLTGTATRKVVLSRTGSATLALSATATRTTSVSRTGTASAALTGTATARVVQRRTGAASLVLSGSATSTSREILARTGSAATILSGTATARVILTRTGLAGFDLDAQATSSGTEIVERTGDSSLNLTASADITVTLIRDGLAVLTLNAIGRTDTHRDVTVLSIVDKTRTVRTTARPRPLSIDDRTREVHTADRGRTVKTTERTRAVRIEARP